MTVRPDHVDFARPVNFSGRKRYSGANASIWQMEGHPGDDICFAPACPAISGGEGDDEEIATRKAVDRHNHRPIQLLEGLSTDAVPIVVGRLCRSPCLP